MRKSEFIQRQIADLTDRRRYIKSALLEAYRTGSRDIQSLCEVELKTIDKCLKLHEDSIIRLRLLSRKNIILS